MDDNQKTEIEIDIALQKGSSKDDLFKLGDLSCYTCPECQGVLWKIPDGNILRFRCHTGHAFSSESLLKAVSVSIEDSLWNAVRRIQENAFLLNHMGDHFAEMNQPKIAAEYFRMAKEASDFASQLRRTTFDQPAIDSESFAENAGAEK